MLDQLALDISWNIDINWNIVDFPTLATNQVVSIKWTESVATICDNFTFTPSNRLRPDYAKLQAYTSKK